MDTEMQPAVEASARPGSADGRWIDLPGVVNMRDVGGLPTAHGRRVRRGQVLRSDNLQDLPPESVRWLVEQAGVTDIVDLRTGVELRGEGEGPMTREPVRIHHLSLYPEGTDDTGIPDDDEDEDDEAGAEELPWQAEQPEPADAVAQHEEHLRNHYLGYLTRRPDNVVAALRVIAHAPGAVVVHCAAGKDRTGTVTALALRLAGVSIDDVAEDYDATNERLSLILQRLRSRPTYADDLADQDERSQSTPASVMRELMRDVDARWGSVEGYLSEHGWTPADTEALRHRLVD